MSRLLNGSTDYLSCTNNSVFGSLSRYSASIWVNLPTISIGGTVGVFGIAGSFGSGERDHVLQVNSSGQVLNYIYDTTISGANTVDSGSTTLRAGKWTSVVCAVDGSTSSLYMDGVMVGQISCGEPYVAYTTAAGFIGAFAASTYMYAHVAKFGLWNRPLSRGHISMLARGAMPHTVRPGSCQISLPLGSKDEVSLGRVPAVFTVNGTPTITPGPPAFRKSRVW